MIHHFKSKQFFAFVMTGGFAAMVNFGSRIVYNQWMSFSSAVIVAYITGMITAFVLAKLFVFKQKKRKIHHSFFFFCLVNLGAVIQTYVISMALAYYLLPMVGVKTYKLMIAHGVGVIFPVFTSYIGHKRYSFKE